MSRRIDLAKARHELRTPINHILGYCEILLDEEDMPERMLADLGHIRTGGKQLLELLSHYLDESNFGRAQNWQQVQHELRTPVNHIIGYTELLIEQATELGQRSLLSDLCKIRTAAEQWLKLMESVLLPQNISASAEPAPPQPQSSESSQETIGAAPRLANEPQGRPLDISASLLVVDDDRPSRELLARRLHRVGYKVSTATDGREALDLIDRTAFDLLLVDSVMPGMDGLELLRLVRQNKTRTELPVIMVTGMDASVDMANALRLGANDYLTKPIDFEVALARLTTQLELRRAQAELNRRIAEMHQMAEELKVRNEFVRQIFGRYVTNEVVQSVLESPKGLELGGEKRVVTVLMSDLRGFTSLTERLAPERVVELLNTYLGAMATVIAQYQGMIDEFIGDAILAIFGAPLARPGHPEAAVACALAMQAEMERVNRRLGRLGVPPLEMGIGVNTGEVVVGNIGSDKRAKYGAVGAQVNLAGRIQSVTVGGEVLISEATAAALGPRLKADRTVTISVKGASAPLKLFEVMGLKGQDHLDLPQFDLPNSAILAQLAVDAFPLLDVKMLAGDSFAAELAVTNPRSGFLKTDRALQARSDLRLVRAGSGQVDLEKVYCKVMDSSAGPLGWAVRFTSALPASWLQR